MMMDYNLCYLLLVEDRRPLSADREDRSRMSKESVNTPSLYSLLFILCSVNLALGTLFFVLNTQYSILNTNSLRPLVVPHFRKNVAQI